MKNSVFQLSSKHILFSSIIASALIAGCPQTSFADVNGTLGINQAGGVKGNVVDNNGEPVIGATIKVDGTNVGALSDLDGNFTLNNVTEGTITVTYVGYKTQKVSFKAGTPIRIRLVEDSQLLDDVVVVGFGTQKKVNLTGSVSVVTSEQFEQRPV